MSQSPTSNFELAKLGRDGLSLSMMEARNHLLLRLDRCLEALAAAQAETGQSNPQAFQAILHLVGRVAWFQEWWVVRNVQRELGREADGACLRLPSLREHADTVWKWEHLPGGVGDSDDGRDQPDVGELKAYLLESLELTLDLLDKANPDARGLYFFQMAWQFEEAANESLLVLANLHGLSHLYPSKTLGVDLPPPGPVRDAILVPSTRWTLGRDADAEFSWDNESPAHGIALPEFEIDAQAVTWQQYSEFVADGGYDSESLWHPTGWHWLQALADADGRRAPRFVEQAGGATGAVLQQHFGQTMRMLGSQPAMHVSWWEADAWCRWAGRRLPSEAEWECAATTTARRGFRWGEVWEWCANRFRPYPGFVAGPWGSYSEPHFAAEGADVSVAHRVLRGASFATRPALRSPKFRGFAKPETDHLFVGFRSCAV